VTLHPLRLLLLPCCCCCCCWCCCCFHRFLYLGTYEDEADAARIWDLAALKSRGISAHTNFELSNYLNSSGEIIAVERLDQAVSRHQAKRNLEPTVSPAEKALAVFLGPSAAAAAAGSGGGCDDDDGDDSDWSPDRPMKQRRTRAVKRKAARVAAAAPSSNSMSSASSGSGSSSSSDPPLLPGLAPKQEEVADASSDAAAGDAAQSDLSGPIAGVAFTHNAVADTIVPAAAAAASLEVSAMGKQTNMCVLCAVKHVNLLVCFLVLAG
jgi:hypothetical protein